MRNLPRFVWFAVAITLAFLAGCLAAEIPASSRWFILRDMLLLWSLVACQQVFKRGVSTCG